MRPEETFKPVKLHQEAGKRTEPPVSVPKAIGTNPAATATPEPLLEPPGVRATLRSHGFQGVPSCVFVPHPPVANSTVCVFPRIIAPCCCKRCTRVAVTVACLSL